MSEMEKNVEMKENECKCFCHSKGFRKFLITALGTFVGVYFALSLFTALHRPPMPPQGFLPYMTQGCPCKMMHHHGIKKFQKEDNLPLERTNRNPAPFVEHRN